MCLHTSDRGSRCESYIVTCGSMYVYSSHIMCVACGSRSVNCHTAVDRSRVLNCEHYPSVKQ